MLVSGLRMEKAPTCFSKVSSFHFLFHYPYITPIYCSKASESGIRAQGWMRAEALNTLFLNPESTPKPPNP